MEDVPHACRAGGVAVHQQWACFALKEHLPLDGLAARRVRRLDGPSHCPPALDAVQAAQPQGQQAQLWRDGERAILRVFGIQEWMACAFVKGEGELK